MKVRDTLIEDIQALLYSGSPHGRLAHLREQLDSGELRDEAARQRIEDLVREAQETLVAGPLSPGAFDAALTHLEQSYLQALRDDAFNARESARNASKGARKRQAEADMAKIEPLLEKAYRPGMGHVKLKEAAASILKSQEERQRERLQNMRSVGNKSGARSEESQLAGLQKQADLLTQQRLGKWLKARRKR